MKNKKKSKILVGILLANLVFSSFALYYSVSTYHILKENEDTITLNGGWRIPKTTVKCYSIYTGERVECEQ